MGRRKQEEIVETPENLEEQVSEETETQEQSLSEEEPEAEAKEEKPKRQRRSRKAKEETVEVEASEEEVSEEAVLEEAEPIEAIEEIEAPKPKRQRNSRKKAATPETQLEVANEAMQKTMEEMVKQWSTVREITGTVASQLEKVAHIVKPSIQDFVNTNDSLVQPKADKSQFAMKFASCASIVAVLLSLVSMSLSQSARTVALNAEATRVASSQLFPAHEPSPKAPEVAFQPKPAETFGPKAKSPSKSKRR